MNEEPPPITISVLSEFRKEDLSKKRLISFLNPVSLLDVINNTYSSDPFDYYIDGSSLCFLLNLLIPNDRITRSSFDFTSIAKQTFELWEESNLKVAVIGAEPEEVNEFQKKVSSHFPNLNLVLVLDGFGEWREKIQHLISCDADILIVGMGSPKQEKFALLAQSLGYTGSTWTCGAFISQTASSENLLYYPKVINYLDLRWLYRFVFEPHTRRRYIIQYPKSWFLLIREVLRRNIKFIVK